MTATVTTDASRPEGSPGSPPAASTVLAVLETVRDPELDEPITSLGFVTSCTVSAGGERKMKR